MYVASEMVWRASLLGHGSCRCGMFIVVVVVVVVVFVVYKRLVFVCL